MLTCIASSTLPGTIKWRNFHFVSTLILDVMEGLKLYRAEFLHPGMVAVSLHRFGLERKHLES